MNDDNTVQSQDDAAPPENTDDSQEAEGVSSKMFDISADLNISPVTDDDEPPIPPLPPLVKPVSDTSPKNLIAKPSTAPVFQSAFTKPPTAPIPQKIPSKPATPPSIPLQDLSVPLAKAQNVPPSVPVPNVPVSDVSVPKHAVITTAPVPPPNLPVVSVVGSTQAPVTPPPVPKTPQPGIPIPIKPTGPLPTQPKPVNFSGQIGSVPTAPAEPTQADIRKGLRTYEGDVAEILARKRSSTASIAIAESVKREEGQSIGSTEPSHAGRKLVITFISLLLVGTGVIAAYYLYSKSPLAPITPVQQQNTPTSIVPADDTKTLTINDMTALAIQVRIQNEFAQTQHPNTIRELVFTENRNGVATRVTGPEMLSRMRIDAPDTLVRSLTSPWMLGIYADASGNKDIFVITTTDFFQNAFAGLLQWEQVMLDDIRQYLYPSSIHGIANIGTSTESSANPGSINPLENLNDILPRSGQSASTTATTSQLNTTQTNQATTTGIAATTTRSNATSTPSFEPGINPYPVIRGAFEDRLIDNKDVREFRTNDGTLIFLYSFIDRAHIIVARQESTLMEVLKRLEKQAFVR